MTLLGADALLGPIREALRGVQADEADAHMHRRRAAISRYSHSSIHQNAVSDETSVFARSSARRSGWSRRTRWPSPTCAARSPTRPRSPAPAGPTSHGRASRSPRRSRAARPSTRRPRAPTRSRRRGPSERSARPSRRGCAPPAPHRSRSPRTPSRPPAASRRMHRRRWPTSARWCRARATAARDTRKISRCARTDSSQSASPRVPPRNARSTATAGSSRPVTTRPFSKSSPSPRSFASSRSPASARNPCRRAGRSWPVGSANRSRAMRSRSWTTRSMRAPLGSRSTWKAPRSRRCCSSRRAWRAGRCTTGPRQRRWARARPAMPPIPPATRPAGTPATSRWPADRRRAKSSSGPSAAACSSRASTTRTLRTRVPRR